MQVRRLAIVAFFTLLTALPVWAAEPTAAERMALEALVEAWIDAEVVGDRAALEAVLHEDFLSTFSSGETVGRDAYIDFILGLDIPPFRVVNESTVIHGDTAVVVDITEDGKTKFTWIAVQREGRWQAIAQTFTTVAPGDGS